MTFFRRSADADGLSAIPDGRRDACYDERRQHDHLSQQKRGLGLSRGHRFQDGDLLKELDDQHKKIEIQRRNGIGHIRLAPAPRQVTGVPRKNRNRQDKQR